MRPPSKGQNNNDGDNEGEKIVASNGMLKHEHAEPYCSPSTMVKERGVPANFR